MCKNCESNKGGESRPTRPMCLELAEAKTDIFGIINALHAEKNIPYYLLEPYVSEAARQVAECAKTERLMASQAYEKQLADFEKKEGEPDGERV